MTPTINDLQRTKYELEDERKSIKSQLYALRNKSFETEEERSAEYTRLQRAEIEVNNRLSKAQHKLTMAIESHCEPYERPKQFAEHLRVCGIRYSSFLYGKNPSDERRAAAKALLLSIAAACTKLAEKQG